MKTKIILALTGVFIVFISVSQQPPAKDALEKKKEKLLKEISALQSDLDNTKKSKNVSLQQVGELKKKIAARQELINTFSSQVNQLDRNISETGKNITSQSSRLKAMQDNYARMVYYSYKHNSSYNTLLFIFSSDGFNEAFQRIKYARRYNTFKKLQAEQIKYTITGLSEKKLDMQEKKQEKKQLMVEQEGQKQKLDKEKTEHQQLAKKLSQKETKLKADIEKKKKEQAKLNKQIQDIIKKEIAAANAAANKASKASNTKSNTSSKSSESSSAVLALTPEAKALSNSFANNQGKFPWPVEKGEVLEAFGTHPHDYLPNVTTKNNGIDIKTSKGAAVRSIFKGTVVSILTNPVYHRAVIVRHGEYFTVYSNLESVNVKIGDDLTTKEQVGKAFTDPETGVTMAHIEVWKGTNYLNPELWLTRR